MKSLSIAICLVIFAPLVAGAASAITPESVVLTTNEITAMANIFQSNGVGSEIKIQNPVGNPSQIRSAVQTFTWNSAEKLGELGVHIGAGSQWTSVQVQNYELRIYGTSGSSVGAEIATFTFQMNQSLATANQWLVFDFGSGLSLTQNSVYFFQLAAVSEGGSILSLKSSFGQGDLLAGGAGNQRGENTVGFATSGAWDFTFYTATAIPEPSSAAALLGVFSLGVVLLRRRRS